MNFTPQSIFDMEVVYKDARYNKLLDTKLIVVFAVPSQNNELNYMEARKASKIKPQSLALRDTETRKFIEK